MKKINFPYIALGLGLFLMLLVVFGSKTQGEAGTVLPLLSLLVMSEFAFFVTAIAAYIGVSHIVSTGIKPLYAITTLLCLLLSLRFMVLGIQLWPL